MSGYAARVAGLPFVLVNDIRSPEVYEVRDALTALAQSAGCVIVMRNLTREKSHTAEVWKAVTGSLSHGMSFTNGNIGFIAALKHLPVQHFTLWF